MQITVPGPNASLYIVKSDLGGVALRTDPLPKGRTFAQAWQDYRKTLVSTGTKILQSNTYSPQRVGLVSAVDTSIAFSPGTVAPQNTVTLWQNQGSYILAASNFPVPAMTRLGQTSALNVLDHYRQGAFAAASDRFCIGEGAITGLTEGGEGVQADIGLKFPPIDALTLTIQTDQVVGNGKDDLIERVSHHPSPPGDQVLRSGERSVATMHGHEYVDVFPDPEFTNQFYFRATFEFGGVADSILQPLTSIDIDAQLTSAVKPQELLAVWDAILTSIRMTQ